MGKIYKRFLVCLLSLTLLLPLCPTPTDAATITVQKVGDKAKYSAYSSNKITLTSRLEVTAIKTLQDYFIKGGDGTDVDAFCLQPHEPFNTGSYLRAEGSVTSVYSTTKANMLIALGAFFRSYSSYIPQDYNISRTMMHKIVQVCIWEITEVGAKSSNLTSSASVTDTASILKYYHPLSTGTLGVGEGYYRQIMYKVTGNAYYNYATTGESYSESYACTQLATLICQKIKAFVDNPKGDLFGYLWNVSGGQRVLATGLVQPYQEIGNIEIYKVDEKGNPLPNAVFRIYDGNTLKAELTTNESGYASTAPGTLVLDQATKQKTFTVIEYSAPAGYEISPDSPWTVTVYADEVARVGGAGVSIVNEHAKGTLELLKKDPDGNLINGAVFGVYSTEACTEDSLVTTFTTGSNGKGSVQVNTGSGYYVKEISAPEGWKVNNTVFGPYEVTRNATTQVNGGNAIIDQPQNGKLDVTKKDADGTVKIAGFTFGLYKDAACSTLVKTAQTDTNGVAHFDHLAPGTYYLKEMAVATGTEYKLNTTVQQVFITTANEATPASASITNEIILRKIQLTKTGYGFASVRKSTADGITIYTPVFGTVHIANAVFDLFAAEDIYSSNGVKRYSKDQKVDTLTTNASGVAISKDLYIGNYYLVEKQAPAGCVPTSEHIAVSVTLSATSTSSYVPVSVTNQRQTVSVTIDKTMEKLYGHNGSEIAEVQFGIYTAAELTAANGNKIPADSLVARLAYTDGGFRFNGTLPAGDYYAKELKTAKAYALDTNTYSFSYSESNAATVNITVNNGKAIENKLKSTVINGNKIDDEGQPVVGAKFGLYLASDTNFENMLQEVVSGEDGTFQFTGVPFGSYVIRETVPPLGYLGTDATETVTVNSTEDEYAVEFTNKLVRGQLIFRKTDSEDHTLFLDGSEFAIYRDVNENGKYDKDIDILVLATSDVPEEPEEPEPEESSEESEEGESKQPLLSAQSEESEEENTEEPEFDSTGFFQFDNLGYGHYLVKEIVSPTGYVLDDNYYPIFLEEDGQTIYLSNCEEEGIFVNDPERGNLLILKTSEDGRKEGFSFIIKSVDVPGGVYYEAIFTTDKDGQLFAEGLRAGKYTIAEIDDEISAKYDILPETEFELVNGFTLGPIEIYNKLTKVVDTGDHYNIVLYSCGMAASVVIAILAIIFLGRKKEKEVK